MSIVEYRYKRMVLLAMVRMAREGNDRPAIRYVQGRLLELWLARAQEDGRKPNLGPSIDRVRGEQ